MHIVPRISWNFWSDQVRSGLKDATLCVMFCFDTCNVLLQLYIICRIQVEQQQQQLVIAVVFGKQGHGHGSIEWTRTKNQWGRFSSGTEAVPSSLSRHRTPILWSSKPGYANRNRRGSKTSINLCGGGFGVTVGRIKILFSSFPNCLLSGAPQFFSC